MFSRFMGIFTLEKRISAELTPELSQIKTDINQLKSDIDELSKRLLVFGKSSDMIRAQVSERISKIEVLFADELSAKEEERDARVRAHREKILDGAKKGTI